MNASKFLIDGENMNYAIIGFGKIGQAIAAAFARNGIKVSVSTTRAPESFAANAASIGEEIIPVKLSEALKADVIFLAVRFESHLDVARSLPNWEGKIVVDMTNAFGVSFEELGRLPSSKVIENAFNNVKVVKGFNHLGAATLAQDPAVKGGRRVVFLSSDDEGAAKEIGKLAENLGFSPIQLGGLSEGGLLVQARGNTWGQLIFKDLINFN